MVQVLKPFEVTDGHTSSIAEDIRNELMAFTQHYLFGFHCGRAICGFDNQFRMESVSILLVNGLLKSGRDEEITRLKEMYACW